jgi:hypothetical protein
MRTWTVAIFDAQTGGLALSGFAPCRSAAIRSCSFLILRNPLPVARHFLPCCAERSWGLAYSHSLRVRVRSALVIATQAAKGIRASSKTLSWREILASLLFALGAAARTVVAQPRAVANRPVPGQPAPHCWSFPADARFFRFPLPFNLRTRCHSSSGWVSSCCPRRSLHIMHSNTLRSAPHRRAIGAAATRTCHAAHCVRPTVFLGLWTSPRHQSLRRFVTPAVRLHNHTTVRPRCSAVFARRFCNASAASAVDRRRGARLHAAMATIPSTGSGSRLNPRGCTVHGCYPRGCCRARLVGWKNRHC